jgi:RNA polymerase sigma-70 factor (ECF subfamily)
VSQEQQGAESADKLMEAALAGESRAFDLLFAEVRPYLQAVAARLLAGRMSDRVDSSDAVQQTMLAAADSIAQFRGRTTAEWRAWVVAILRNEVHNLLRYWHQECRDINREQLAITEPNAGFTPASDASTPSERVSRREGAFELMAAIKRLNPSYREIIELRHFEGLPYKDIAVRMNRSDQAARQLWFRALGQLRKELEEAV